MGEGGRSPDLPMKDFDMEIGIWPDRLAHEQHDP